jgi:hypothetical protein
VRIDQAREGWHLGSAPEQPRRIRSTRHRQNLPDLPAVPRRHTTVGRTYQASDGKTCRPSTFGTLTLPSFGKVRMR